MLCLCRWPRIWGGWGQVQTGSTWYGQAVEGLLHQPMPTLVPMALRLGHPATAVLTAGSYSASLLSEHGHLLHKLDLPVRPAPEREAQSACVLVPVSTLKAGHGCMVCAAAESL